MKIVRSKKLFIHFSIPVFLLISILTDCAAPAVRHENEKNIINLKDNQISELLKKIREINNASPDSFTADLYLYGNYNRKQFKATGAIEFSKEPGKMKITFFDSIFRTILTTIIQDGETIKLFFPVENAVYIDSIKKIELKNYADINLDYNFMAELATGRIPVIKDYSVKNALAKGENGQGNESEVYIILENNEYYETIAFKKNIPDKILIQNKKSKEKTEILLESPLNDNDIIFFRSIRFILAGSDTRITVEYSNIKFNINIDSKKITKIDLPKGCKIIYTE